MVEVGCNLAGTAVLGSRMLERLGIDKRYICYDTFDGFADEQFASDHVAGTPRRDRDAFSENSKRLVERILRQHSSSRVELVQGDIAMIPDEMLPDEEAMLLVPRDPRLTSIYRSEKTVSEIVRRWRDFWSTTFRRHPHGKAVVDTSDSCPKRRSRNAMSTQWQISAKGS